jgi:hypothetical protein
MANVKWFGKEDFDEPGIGELKARRWIGVES